MRKIDQSYDPDHPITNLCPHPRNPRQGDVGAIYQSIEANGFYGAVMVQASTGFVVAGNHRLEAARAAGADTIPAIIADLTDEEATRILLVDNRTNDLATYSDPDLADLLQELHALTGTLDGTGYDGDDLDALLDDLGRLGEPEPAPSAQVDRAGELRKKWGVKRGQLWRVGRHRLLCGDSTNPEDVALVMQGEKAEMAFTDPPYGVDYSGGIQFKPEGVQKHARERLAGDDTSDIYTQAVPILAANTDGPVYVSFAGTKALHLYAAVEKHGEAHALIVWVKNGGYGALNANYKPRHEPILYWKPKGSTLRWDGPTTESTVWEIDKDGTNKLHPTQKPVELVERAIRNHQARTVFEPFCGSGSTIVASERTRRACYAVEVEPAYVAVTLERLSDMGLTPELDA